LTAEEGEPYRAPNVQRKEVRSEVRADLRVEDQQHGRDASGVRPLPGREPDPGPGFVGLKVLKDRDRENSFLVIAEFESYDLAMQNSARPEVDAFNKEMMALADGPPTFGNYDVIDES
jgi:hypothetical protein